MLGCFVWPLFFKLGLDFRNNAVLYGIFQDADQFIQFTGQFLVHIINEASQLVAADAVIWFIIGSFMLFPYLKVFIFKIDIVRVYGFIQYGYCRVCIDCDCWLVGDEIFQFLDGTAQFSPIGFLWRGWCCWFFFFYLLYQH